MNIDIIKILLVEDDMLIADSLRILLEDFGFEIAAICNTYNQATESMNTKSFDILLTDINLGKGIETESGIHLAQYCKTHFQKPIIYITAYADKQTISQSASTQPVGYLVKPINENTLFATIQLAIENFNTNINTNKVSNNLTEVDYFFVKTGKINSKVYWKDIYHLEAVKNYVKLGSYSGQTNLLIRSTLSNFIKNILPTNYTSLFIKINRSSYILKSIILQYDKNKIITTQGSFEWSGDFKA